MPSQPNDKTEASILVASGLWRRFARRTVVRDLSLHVGAGEIVALLGPNGAGKTTTFRMLAGLLRPHGGRVLLGGTEVTRWPLWKRARAGVGYLPQRPTIFRRLTVAENIDAALVRLGLPRAERVRRRQDMLVRFELAGIAATRGQALSGGERRRVEIVRAFAAQPSVLLVDEPFAGLDPRSAAVVSDNLQALAQHGVAVLVTDHDVRQTLEACDRAYILESGHVLTAGEPEEITNNEHVRAKYLGARFELRGTTPTPSAAMTVADRT